MAWATRASRLADPAPAVPVHAEPPPETPEKTDRAEALQATPAPATAGSDSFVGFAPAGAMLTGSERPPLPEPPAELGQKLPAPVEPRPQTAPAAEPAGAPLTRPANASTSPTAEVPRRVEVATFPPPAITPAITPIDTAPAPAELKPQPPVAEAAPDPMSKPKLDVPVPPPSPVAAVPSVALVPEPADDAPEVADDEVMEAESDEPEDASHLAESADGDVADEAQPISDEEIAEIDEPSAAELSGPSEDAHVLTKLNPWYAQLVYGHCPPEGTKFVRPTPPTNFPGREAAPPTDAAPAPTLRPKAEK